MGLNGYQWVAFIIEYVEWLQMCSKAQLNKENSFLPFFKTVYDLFMIECIYDWIT